MWVPQGQGTQRGDRGQTEVSVCLFLKKRKMSKVISAGCKENAATFISFYYISGLQLASEYGGCSQLIGTPPLKCTLTHFRTELENLFTRKHSSNRFGYVSF